MPKPTTATAVPATLITDATLSKAQEIAARSYGPVWTGPSGEESSGEAVARHLEATIALLDKDGWSRVHTCFRDRNQDKDRAGDVNPDDESMTVKQMLRALLRFVHDDIGLDLDPRRTLDTALRHVGEDGTYGDSDTAHVATCVLDRLVQAHTGSDYARATAWSERQHRTHADITALLTAGARFARTYGPASASDRAA
ncbi:hypothetical protein RM717_24455 [Streptomyces griseus]|uniref:Uncharacterized protein n=1 Tax=Streptomyces stephensoniae TaxID=3375367 RepID=A0ABU2W718_9ACTN|nr:hypothetical protein [Streptomyces griseus]MDT0493656.1 hypothetical protein [Streptomyces griseus]